MNFGLGVRIVKYFYEHLIDKQTGTPACTLIRCFKTYPYGKLDAELGESVRSVLGYTPPSTMQCLTLLATCRKNPISWERSLILNRTI
ncbi:MAG: hypothetical protein DSM106950_39690 [Stigonema ocellatum SAG 48.90 = DSM 106950]|nr:hypothetical protein [Stigonema ocellatum SAG 48.90 = DSM 106950]